MQLWNFEKFPEMKCAQDREGRRDRDRMIMEFTTTYAISSYHH